MWSLYTAIGITLVVLYFLVRLEWVYWKCERLIIEEGFKEYRDHYPTWERMIFVYWYIWRFASLKGKP